MLYIKDVQPKIKFHSASFIIKEHNNIVSGAVGFEPTPAGLCRLLYLLSYALVIASYKLL